MLLFGFLLLFTASVAAEYDYFPVKLCIDDGRVRTLILPFRPGPETSGCISFGDSGLVIFLNLRHRCIKSFKKGWFGLAPALSSIDLSHNQITEITTEVLNDLPSSLKKVYIRYNRIQRLRAGTMNLENVITMDLSNNRIHTIENRALENVPRLRNLILTRNRLTDLKFAATLPPDLKLIFLDKNKIRAMEDRSFANTPNVAVLNLAYNDIQTVESKVLAPFKDLYSVDFSFNPFTKYEEAKLVLKIYHEPQD